MYKTYKTIERKGFTLIELIVGLGLVSIFALAAMSFLVSQLRVNTTQSQISHAQTSMEATMNLIRWDVMMAGFGTQETLIPHSGGSSDDTRPEPDMLEVVTYNSPVGGNGHWGYLTQRVDGSADILVRRWQNNVFSNIDVGDSVVLFDINKIKVAEGKVVNVQVISSNEMRIRLNQPISAKKGTLVFALPHDGRTHITYSIINGNLFRNNVMLQENVEDIQVSYWVDSNENGIEDAGEWVPTFTTDDLPKLKLVRISIVKLSGPDVNHNEQGRRYTVEDDIYTVPAQSANFRRHIYTIVVKPRNLGV